MQSTWKKYFISALIYHDSAIYSDILWVNNVRIPEKFFQNIFVQSWFPVSRQAVSFRISFCSWVRGTKNSAQAFMRQWVRKELKIFLLFSSDRQENSGCHCTAWRYVFSGAYTASINPSSETAMGESPGASLQIAWWWQLFTIRESLPSRSYRGLSRRISTAWAGIS